MHVHVYSECLHWFAGGALGIPMHRNRQQMQFVGLKQYGGRFVHDVNRLMQRLGNLLNIVDDICVPSV